MHYKSRQLIMTHWKHVKYISCK